MASDENILPAFGLVSGRWGTPGTYALVMEIMQAGVWEIGRFGPQHFPAGHYIYVGSALGPGGLSARIERHLRVRKRIRWHIDYLLRWAVIRQIGVRLSEQHLECAWATALLSLSRARIVVPRFGASDCRCKAHLIYWNSLPHWRETIAVSEVLIVSP